jgi:general secretion pathway protein M
MVVAAIAMAVVALVYAAAIEPAWRTRARLARELPQLQEQLAEIQALRDEARLLRQQGFGSDTGGSLRANLERSLVRAGLTGKLRADSERSVAVSAAGVPAQAWFAWMEEFARESRVRIVRARIIRSGAPGMVEAEAGFELPGG